ncbi:MAG TPA: hypothetical protein VNO30_00040 [Kofleriaceae bacterium]|nr:hypothetical protein [Kofleriaceae bacterium]
MRRSAFDAGQDAGQYALDVVREVVQALLARFDSSRLIALAEAHSLVIVDWCQARVTGS